MRNFSKFQDTSFLHTGLQMISLGSVIRDVASSLGVGSLSFRNANRRWASFPFTSIFSKSWNLGSKPFPGRTYFSDRRISSFLQFSCTQLHSWLILIGKNQKIQTSLFPTASIQYYLNPTNNYVSTSNNNLCSPSAPYKILTILKYCVYCVKTLCCKTKISHTATTSSLLKVTNALRIQLI